MKNKKVVLTTILIVLVGIMVGCTNSLNSKDSILENSSDSSQKGFEKYLKNNENKKLYGTWVGVAMSEENSIKIKDYIKMNFTENNEFFFSGKKSIEDEWNEENTRYLFALINNELYTTCEGMTESDYRCRGFNFISDDKFEFVAEDGTYILTKNGSLNELTGINSSITSSSSSNEKSFKPFENFNNSIYSINNQFFVTIPGEFKHHETIGITNYFTAQFLRLKEEKYLKDIKVRYYNDEIERNGGDFYFSRDRDDSPIYKYEKFKIDGYEAVKYLKVGNSGNDEYCISVKVSEKYYTVILGSYDAYIINDANQLTQSIIDSIRIQ